MADGSSFPPSVGLGPRLAALPPHIASFVEVLVEREARPISTHRLEALVTQACATLGASPADFARLTPAQRQAMVLRLNRNALRSPRDSRCPVACSTALRRLIRETARIATNPTAARRQIWKRLLCGVASAPDAPSDPTCRTGRLTANGWQITYRLDYRAAAGPLAPLVPWNDDLVRRRLTLGLPLAPSATTPTKEPSDGAPA